MMEYKVVTKTFRHPLNHNNRSEQFTDDFNSLFDDSFEIIQRKVSTYKEEANLIIVVTFLLHNKQ